MDSEAIPTARVIIADDHRLVAEGLRRLVEPPHLVLGVVHSGDDLLRTLRTTPAHCLLLDLVMPSAHGLVLMPTIRTLQPGLKVVVVTMLTDPCIADASFRAGALAFVPKNADRDDLLAAIEAVLENRRYRSSRVPKTGHGVGWTGAPGFERLTPRQHAIMRMLGEGKRPAHIAAAFGLGRSTITFHLHNLMRILGAPSTDDLVKLAVLHDPPAVENGRE
jgi:DNA-binding NarL/FixJ family response regulator